MKKVALTDFERDVTISLLETALDGWEGQQARQNAAQRVVDKLRALDDSGESDELDGRRAQAEEANRQRWREEEMEI